MPLSTYAGTTEYTELIPTEVIPSFVQGYEFRDRVGMQIAWGRPGQGNVPVRFPRFNLLGATSGAGVPAGTKNETVAFTDVLIDTTESSITPGLVGFRLPISDEAVLGASSPAGGAVPAQSLAECLAALAERIDTDILSSSTSATNQEGAVTDAYDLSRFRSDLSAFRALDVPPGAMVALTLGHTAANELLAAMHASSATMVTSRGDSAQLGAADGLMGTFHGVEIFETGGLPSESTGLSGLMTQVGDQRSAYGIVMNEMPNIRPTRGDEAEQRAVTFYVVRAWYGTGLTNPRRCIEVLQKA